jgi:hypothetical protein
MLQSLLAFAASVILWVLMIHDELTKTQHQLSFKRGRNQSAQLRFLGELQKPEADYSELEQLLVQLCARGWRHENARKTKKPPLWWACCR